MTNKRVFKIKDSWEMRTNISTIVEQKNNRKFPKIHNKNWLIKQQWNGKNGKKPQMILEQKISTPLPCYFRFFTDSSVCLCPAQLNNIKFMRKTE